MIKSCLLFLSIFSFAMSYGQKELSYPQGITVDPAIEKLCKSKKDINSFKIAHLINDTISSQPILSSLNEIPLTSFVTLDKKDTLLTFMGMFIPWGFQINLRTTGCEVLTFVSSRSCKCFKDSLSESNLNYGAGARSSSVTLVLNKMNDIKLGDKIYGYIKTKGGNIYHISGVDGKYDKWNFGYEGFFVVEFKPINQ